jgi:hypothetical protein
MVRAMNDGDLSKVYMSLLRGLANEAQDSLCASDRQHDWSKWHRTALRHDIPLTFAAEPTVVMNETYRVKSERHCLNCGKAEVI